MANVNRLGRAWSEAAAQLGIDVAVGFEIDNGSRTITCDALIRGFGGPNGTAIISMDSAEWGAFVVATEKAGYFASGLGDAYEEFDRELFVGTLNDWGWKGDEADRPTW